MLCARQIATHSSRSLSSPNAPTASTLYLPLLLSLAPSYCRLFAPSPAPLRLLSLSPFFHIPSFPWFNLPIFPFLSLRTLGKLPDTVHQSCHPTAPSVQTRPSLPSSRLNSRRPTASPISFAPIDISSVFLSCLNKLLLLTSKPSPQHYFSSIPGVPTMPIPRRPVSTSSSSSSSTSTTCRYSDRFIPHRAGSGDLQSAFELLRRPASLPAHTSENNSNLSNQHPTSTSQSAYAVLLKSELLDTPPATLPPTSPTPHPGQPHLDPRTSKRRTRSEVCLHHPGLEGHVHSPAPSGSTPPHLATPNLLRFSYTPSPERDDSSGPFCMAGAESRRALLSASYPGRVSRKIARAPFKVLDAPCLQNDFYLNLVDWSSQNVLAVGLGSCVYLWSAHTSVVTKLCDLPYDRAVCSVAWSQQGTELAVGTAQGCVQVWDTGSCKLLRTLSGHDARASCLAWSSSLLSSGGRDNEIYNRDLRCKEAYVARLSGHKQEVCGLKWSPDDMQLASGGNDNTLLIWNAAGLGSGGSSFGTGSGVRYNKPAIKFDYHEAAVKAIAWSPHARGLLASGGGTKDKKIRFWNTMTDAGLAAVDTGSQVCNLAWSKNVNELVSTHGYSQNQIIVWKYPTLSKVVTLLGHSCRVLYLAMSPSGETIVTGAGDETLRFWNVFPSAKSKRGKGENSSVLSPSRMSIR